MNVQHSRETRPDESKTQQVPFTEGRFGVVEHPSFALPIQSN